MEQFKVKQEGGYPGQCLRYPAPDNVQDTLTQTMSELEKFALQGGGGYPRQCPRYPAPGLNLPLKHWHTLTLLHVCVCVCSGPDNVQVGKIC